MSASGHHGRSWFSRCENQRRVERAFRGRKRYFTVLSASFRPLNAGGVFAARKLPPSDYPQSARGGILPRFIIDCTRAGGTFRKQSGAFPHDRTSFLGYKEILRVPK